MLFWTREPVDIKRQRIQIRDNTEGAMGVTCTLTRIVRSESCVTNTQADELGSV